MSEDKNEIVSGSFGVANEILKAAKDSPEIREAGTNLASSAVILTKTLKNCLVPLAMINFGFDKARQYFNSQFPDDLSASVKLIPAENLVEPKASIAGPTLQGLAFAHEEIELKEMFLNLLATSMDNRKNSLAHPSFVEIIRQLDATEAAAVKLIVSSGLIFPIAQLRLVYESEQFKVVEQHLMNSINDATGEMITEPELPSQVTNWIRLGLVDVDYSQSSAQSGAYDWVNKRPEYLRHLQSLSDGERIQVTTGLLRPTPYGIRFGHAIGLTDNES